LGIDEQRRRSDGRWSLVRAEISVLDRSAGSISVLAISMVVGAVRVGGHVVVDAREIFQASGGSSRRDPDFRRTGGAGATDGVGSGMVGAVDRFVGFSVLASQPPVVDA